jgi:defect-in-organelle-trafficking protein DotB
MTVTADDAENPGTASLFMDLPEDLAEHTSAAKDDSSGPKSGDAGAAPTEAQSNDGLRRTGVAVQGSGMPVYFNESQALVRLLAHVAAREGSDVHIGGDEPIRARIHGLITELTPRRITSEEAFDLLVQAYGGNASAEARVRAGDRVDTSFECATGATRTRWRVNAAGRMKRATPDLRIVLRRITSVPPQSKDIGLEPELVEVATSLQKGMCVITGPTGSGKSTTLAAILRRRIEDPKDHSHIVTLEAPIEYSYDDVECRNSVVTQIEIGLNLPSFAVGVENALRQDPDVILVGESRDFETINASLLAAQTGHALYTTSHDNGVANTMRRMLRAFPAAERAVAQLEFTSALHMVLSQRLIPSTDGRRVALREYLVFDSAVKDLIRSADDVYVATLEALRRYGRPMVVDAQQKFKDGRICQAEYDKIEVAARLEGGAS